jgi:hypothetical protein
MSRRALVSVAALAVIATAGLSAGILGLGTGASAQTLDLNHSRWANRISGVITQDLLVKTHGVAPLTAHPLVSSGVEPPTVSSYGCSQTDGTNVRANQDCTNDTSPAYPGRGQAQNETSIAVNPTNAENVLGSQNDYRRGDGTCGADFSLDGGAHWGSSVLPVGFSVPGVDHPNAARHYWTSSGDPSVAFDSEGAAYYDCGVFDRSYPTNDDAFCANPAGNCASGIFVFRSVDGGASWNFPRGAAAAGGAGQVIVTRGLQSSTQFTLEDKPYMAIDDHVSSPFRDRIYVAWTHYAPCKASQFCITAPIYLSYSSDHGTTFSHPKAISGTSNLCAHPLNPDTPSACDNDSFAEPVVAANGDVYVVFANYNNAVSGNDNHNNILEVKSSDGGVHWSSPRRVAKFYDLPDCYTYTGDDLFRSCVPTQPRSHVSVFRAADYPSAAADPTDPNKIYVTFGSYINPDSNRALPRGHGHCAPNGLSSVTFLNLYKDVNDINGCNNDILLSVTDDGGKTWSADQSGPEHATVVSNEGGTTLANQWWQWAAINSSGTLAVSYYDRQYGNDQSNGDNDITLAASTGGGAFAHSRVTSLSTPPPTQFPDMVNGYSVFMGDYSGLAVSGTAAYPMWADARNIEQFQCPSNADPLLLCRVLNGNVPGFDEDVFSTAGLSLPGTTRH